MTLNDATCKQNKPQTKKTIQIELVKNLILKSIILASNLQFILKVKCFLKKLKKDSRLVDFDAERIKNAIHKALLAVELVDGEKAESITKAVVKISEDKFKEGTPTGIVHFKFSKSESVAEYNSGILCFIARKNYILPSLT
jgi:hypothetical protein